MIKYSILALLIQFIFSCDPKTNSENENHNFRGLSKESSDISKKLIGNWGIYSEQDKNGNGIYCNACPKVNFKSDGSAIVVKPSGEKEFWKWESSGKQITLYSSDSTYNTFSDRNYELIFTGEKEYSKLELRQKSKNYSYLLGRAN